MKYKVLNSFPIEKNTSVTIEGNGEGLINNMFVTDYLGNVYKLISVALLSGYLPEDKEKTTTVLIEGKFDSEVIIT